MENRKLLTEQVANQISGMIIGNHLEAGAKIPNEFELAGLLNVGRGTVREAVKLLVSRNILVIRRGKGTFVANHPGVVEDPLGFAYVQNKYSLALDLLEIRLIVEPEFAMLAALRATPRDMEEITGLCDKVEALIKAEIPHVKEDIELHTKIAKSTQNQVAPNLIPIINESIFMFVELTQYSLGQETVETHRKLVNAITARQPEEAGAIMRQHIVYNQEQMRRWYGPKE